MTSHDLASQEYVAVDVESTGLNPQNDQIIEIGIVVFTSHCVVDSYSQTIKPRRKISKDISRLTGITQEELDESPAFIDVQDDIRARIGSRPIVGHNVSFDISMLRGEGMDFSNTSIDTYRLASSMLPNMPNYQLGTIATHLGYEIPDDDRHRALGDALGTVHVFQRLLELLDEYDPATLTQVAQFARAANWPEASVFEGSAQSRREAPLFQQSRDSTVPLELRFLAPRERPEALRPTGNQDPISVEMVERMLGEDGPMTKVLERYEPRRTQITMARRVAESFNKDGSLLVEAGTGTGKSLAYLLPAAIYALQRGERVVVSTATIALQDQLFHKDLPDVHYALIDSGLNDELHVAVMKGRANYLCLKQWFTHVNDPIDDEADASLRAKILLWLGQTESGDRAELRLTFEEERHWRKFASERGRCTVGRCAYASSNQCFFHRARLNAQHAHIVIANHSLVLSNAAEGRVLPGFERLIVDEAHHLEDEATRQLSFTLDRSALDDRVKMMVREDGAVVGGALPVAASLLLRMGDASAAKRETKIREHIAAANDAVGPIASLSGELFTRLAALIGKPRFGGSTYAQSQRITDQVRYQSAFQEAALIWDNLSTLLRTLLDAGIYFQQVLDDVALPGNDNDPLVVQRDEAMVDLISSIDELSDVVRLAGECFGEAPESRVVWVQRSGQQQIISLNSAPLDVSVLLNQYVYAGLRTIVMTSATMTIDGSFGFISEHLGLQDAKVLDLGSPFDHEESTLIYIPEDVPEPNDPRYSQFIVELLRDTLVATGGRALVLFTSHKALRDARNALKADLEAHNIVLLGQGVDGNSRTLIERLRTEPGTVVFGTSTFWEGVDIVGDALSLLVIAKFPFSVPSDPIFEARSELYDNPFMELSLPLAVLKFKQGFGRLIRTAQDRGVCVILDRRVISKRYGSMFVQSLPPANVTVGSSFDVAETASAWISPSRR